MLQQCSRSTVSASHLQNALGIGGDKLPFQPEPSIHSQRHATFSRHGQAGPSVKLQRIRRRRGSLTGGHCSQGDSEQQQPTLPTTCSNAAFPSDATTRRGRPAMSSPLGLPCDYFLRSQVTLHRAHLALPLLLPNTAPMESARGVIWRQSPSKTRHLGLVNNHPILVSFECILWFTPSL